MEKSKKYFETLYNKCEKLWNETHDCIWINGEMSERVKFAEVVEREMMKTN